MDHWKQAGTSRERAWRFLDEAVRADVVLLQETSPPPGRKCVGYREGGIDRRRAWGSCVYAPRMIAAGIDTYAGHGGTFDLHGTYPGSVAVARIESEDFGPVTLVSVYGRLDKGWALPTIHHVLSDLTPLLHAERRRNLILGGDLNVSTQLSSPWRRYQHNAFERIELFGLVNVTAAAADGPLANCPCADEPCRHVQTQDHPRSRVPWQNDYLFATKTLADGLRGCEVVQPRDEHGALSDHRVVVAHFGR